PKRDSAAEPYASNLNARPKAACNTSVRCAPRTIRISDSRFLLLTEYAAIPKMAVTDSSAPIRPIAKAFAVADNIPRVAFGFGTYKAGIFEIIAAVLDVRPESPAENRLMFTRDFDSELAPLVGIRANRKERTLTYIGLTVLMARRR
ncbi:MAG TPA: hypothetical protein VKV95_13995, partial [Terriglobia bacterium]|nr:hypothetical protein [Terriglobia bacterium]